MNQQCHDAFSENTLCSNFQKKWHGQNISWDRSWHKVYSIYIHLCLWENILIGQSCWLSCCGVWYSSGLEILPFLFEVLGVFVLKKNDDEKTIVSHTPQLVRNSYQSQIWHLASFKAFYICCLLLYWVWSNLVDPCERLIMLPR